MYFNQSSRFELLYDTVTKPISVCQMNQEVRIIWHLDYEF